ncbi:MAG TPA: peptidylprolyl isomerase [Jiangellaceae bacterium]
MASTKERRRRQLAREKWERQQARRTVARRRRLMILAIVVAVALIGGLVVALGAWLSSDRGTEPTATEGPCVYTEIEAVEGIGLPPGEPVAATTATITLNGSPVTVELLADDAPCTVNSLVHLAGAGYFDGTSCHRLATSDSLRVLQCGDPTATGSGGPGYQFGLENVDGATYEAGTVAMARRADDPDSNGSQFFLVYEDSQLPPDYTVFGRITDGIDVLTEVAEAGTEDGSTDGAPAEPVTIDSLVTEP